MAEEQTNAVPSSTLTMLRIEMVETEAAEQEPRDPAVKDAAVAFLKSIEVGESICSAATTIF